MRTVLQTLAAAFALVSLSDTADAKVTDSSTNGFAIIHSAEVNAKPEAIWAQLTHPERWWSKDHSWSGNAANFSLRPVPGGCFCEKLPDAGFAEHARVIYAAPGKMLRLSGAFGPLQGEALVGTLTITIKPMASGDSLLTFNYVVGGYSRLSLTDIAPGVDGVLAEQHGRLMKLFLAR